ncbi:Uncharacterised protein [Mycoplasma putrefaciens]|nr:Uncharacterised protein [Mycoplasma putrefaciens]
MISTIKVIKGSEIAEESRPILRAIKGSINAIKLDTKIETTIPILATKMLNQMYLLLKSVLYSIK